MHEHAEARLGTSEPGSVILEVGEGTGALILLTPPELDGLEIDIMPQAGGLRTHSMVRERRTGTRTVHAAVYPGLPEGDYLVLRAGGSPVGQVAIRGGHAAQFRWPEG
jgi:hypothetical protein